MGHLEPVLGHTEPLLGHVSGSCKASLEALRSQWEGEAASLQESGG